MWFVVRFRSSRTNYFTSPEEDVPVLVPTEAVGLPHPSDSVNNRSTVLVLFSALPG